MRQFSRIVSRAKHLPGRPLRRFATLATELKPGDTLHGFTVKQVEEVPEFELVATQLVHDKTGAHHLHIGRDDKNNYFSIGFGTPSMNSTGIAHILEHTTLCGSKKYPVRDPFFKMLNRSYAHFMNAFTSQYHTFYPFGTTNQIDYENLRSVYLDCTLNPLLRELDFRQEGWRLEHVNPQDASTPIIFKGIVFNEMKGVLSNAGVLYYEQFIKHMYPNTIYGFNSGGDPLDIPSLTYNDLKEFHRKHYHPSNSRIYTYGNIPLSSHLSTLDQWFNQYSHLPTENFSASASRFPSPKKVEITCPLDPLTDPAKQNLVSLGFHANELLDGIFEHFAINVLVNLLIDGHSAPLRKALLDTDIGTDWTPNTAHDSSGQTAFVAFGLQGVAEGNESLVESEILRVLSEVAETGFESDRIEGILHQMELSLKHKSAKFGEKLMWTTVSTWFDGINPIETLQWNARIERLRSEIAAGPFFQNLIKKYFLDNPSRLTLIMRPEPQYSEKAKANENALLSEKLDALSEEDKKKVFEQGLALLEAQEKPADVSSLPTLALKDIPIKGEIHPTVKERVDEVPLQWRIAPTNSITYFKATSSLDGFPSHLRPYLSLFADALSSLGTVTKSASEFEDEINLKTDGIQGGVSITSNHSDLDRFEESLVISSACLDKNITAMYDLIRQFMLETNWDNEKKLDNLIKNKASGIVNDIASAGSRFAALYASSKLTPAKAATEVTAGMSQIRLLCQMARRNEHADLIAKLKEIASFVFSQKSLRVAITCGNEVQSENRSALSTLLLALPKFEIATKSQTPPITTLPSRAFFTLPYSVNYAALSLKGIPYTHPDSPALRILANFIDEKRMHPEIREKGGAYGGSASFLPLDGMFSLTSYRDPSFERSLDVMRNAGQWATSQTVTDETLQEMKLSIFKYVDAPISVRNEGMMEFVHGITDEMRQTWRERALAVTAAHVQEVAQKYLVEPISRGQTSEAVLGGITETISKSPEWEKFDFDLSISDEQEQAQASETNAG